VLFPNTREISSFFLSEKILCQGKNCRDWTPEAVHCHVGKEENLWNDAKKLLGMVVVLLINLYEICVPELKIQAKVYTKSFEQQNVTCFCQENTFLFGRF